MVLIVLLKNKRESRTAKEKTTDRLSCCVR
jgi:hypothetical protein